MRPRWTRWLKFAVPGCIVLQLTACFGSDPQFYVTSTIANAVVFNVVSALFDLALSGLAAPALVLLG